MAAHVLRLRIALLLGAFRGTPAQITRSAVSLAIVIIAVAVASWALLTLRDAPIDVVLTVTVLGGSAVTLGFLLAPLIGGATDQLDPRRFAVLGLPPGRLAVILAVAGLISVPVLALLVISIVAAVVWIAHGVAAPVAILGVVLGVLTCALVARVCMALTALFLRERRSRELSGLFVLALLVVVVPVGVFLASLEWRGSVPTQLEEAVDIIGVTPLGAAWGYPGFAAADDSATWVALAVSVVTLGVLAAGWLWLVRHALSTTERPVTVRERGGLGWFAVAPGTATGGIAARSLVYWLRDARYLVNMAVIPVAALLTMVPLLIAGVPLAYAALLPAPFIALFLGWLPHNDIAYDSTAIWMHIASGVRGIADRLGRLVPVLLIGIPLLAVAIPISLSVHGRWAVLPAMIGVCASLFLCGLGLSSIASAVAPYAVSRPGESPFQQPQRTGSAGGISQGLVIVGSVVLSGPALWWAWLSLSDGVAYADIALWAGLATGLVVLAVGVVLGAVAFERRSGRIMEFAEST